ncbi:MAG: NADH-quinone oxidoreductase subunit NuoG [Actinomycetota bacterium]|nr:NADH-quinone oxidoreductase subunit NuoG [Actinomycetota bacterium]
MSDNGKVSVTINGLTTEAEPGRLLIDVAEELNVFVPRFCYHPGMKSVAVCRMCLVKVEGQNKLLPACATPVADGMNVNTVDEQAVDAQRGMLEFLLINHPLDCPICDRAGECPLQDQTYRHGPGSSRYIEPKRTYEKALEISDLVVLDRERCVLCWRCVRFCDEVSGDRFIQLVDRGAGTQILTFSDEPFDSYFSGNTIQICPVGALLSKPYRFVARPWDLQSAPSVCAYCSVGCPLTNETRAEKLVRCQALPNEHVNDFWICDKGRFGYHYVDSDERITTPLVRDGDEFRHAQWSEALDLTAAKLGGKDKVAVIAGGHLTTEDCFAVARLARDVVGTPHVDSRIQDAGAPYELALRLHGAAGSSATLDDLDAARTIVWAAGDPKETLPVLFLRLRKAVLENNAKLIVVSPRAISLDAFATHVIRCEAQGEAAAIAALGNPQHEVSSDIGSPAVVCWGSASPGRDEAAVAGASIELARSLGAGLLMCVPHAGSQGALDMGLHPFLAPGYEVIESGGKDTRAILEAAAAGELDALVLVGADPIADFPDAELALRALESDTFVVAIEMFATESATRADVVLPSVAYAEREGTFTNLERRIQKLEPVVPARGATREPWAICVALAERMGTSWGWSDLRDVWKEIGKLKSHAEVDIDALRGDPLDAPATPLHETPWQTDPTDGRAMIVGPGARYPKGYRAGAPFQTGQNWPLSWELRAYEARERPGTVPSVPGEPVLTGPASNGHRLVTGEGLALYTGRFIYDSGAMVSRSRALHRIAKRPFVELNATDAAARQIADGDEVVVEGNGVQVRLKAVVGDIAEGAAFVPFDQPGFRANTLIGSKEPRVEVRKA